MGGRGSASRAGRGCCPRPLALAPWRRGFIVRGWPWQAIHLPWVTSMSSAALDRQRLGEIRHTCMRLLFRRRWRLGQEGFCCFMHGCWRTKGGFFFSFKTKHWALYRTLNIKWQKHTWHNFAELCVHTWSFLWFSLPSQLWCVIFFQGPASRSWGQKQNGLLLERGRLGAVSFALAAIFYFFPAEHRDPVKE